MRKAFIAAVQSLLLLLGSASPGAAQSGGGDDNTAVAINTEDGATVFRLAFSIRRVANGVVDETNTAAALASCTDCQTIALAFQVVLVSGDADVVVPENRAIAVNFECTECVTYASATQIVLGFDGPVRFTAEGNRRLAMLHKSLRELEDAAADMTLAELNAAVQAAKTELVTILSEEVVEPGPPATTTTTTTTSTTAPDGTTTSTTSTTVEESTTTTDTSTTTTVDETTTTSAP